ncbi:MAG: sulfite exporter TauE/SafE family protein [Clostridia bacterium]|nr:sulfite exporter TauE/SafE family protein [Clostridia bacterium]
MKNLIKQAFFLLPLGLLAGFINGLLGAAGGIAVVLGLRALHGKRVANGRSFYTTALAVMLPLSILTVWQYAGKGHLPATSLEAVVFPALVGGACGALLLPHVPTGAMHRIFSVAVIVSGLLLVA